MSKEEIEKIIFKALNKVNHQNGFEDVVLKNEVIPRNNIEGFDSLCEIEATIEIQEMLGVNFKYKNYFVDKNNIPINVNEIISSIYLIIERLEKHNAKESK